MQASGGYVIHRQPLIRRGVHAHTSALKQPVSEADLAALNAVQATAWRINQRVLDVMLAAWNGDLPLGGFAKATPEALPDKVDAKVWDGMAKEDRREHLKVRGAIHARNASAEGRQNALVSCLSVAQELRDYPAIYFPHSRCFRGRLHPIPTWGPQPQGDDKAKALLEFAEGKPLGVDGLYWLCIRLANSCGMDKASLQERHDWAWANAGRVQMAAADPIGNPWWSDADEPWQALATCFELADAWALDDPTGFLSNLPIPLDG